MFLSNFKVFIIGGYRSDGPIDTVEIFDPNDYRLRIMTERLPEKFLRMGLLQMGDKILALGGSVVNPTWKDTDLFYEIDPATESVIDTGLKTPTRMAVFHVKIYNE